MMGEINRLIGVVMVALACVCMWGCTEVTFEWYDERSKPSIAGFINDSFVVVTDCRGWYEDTETKWNSGYATERSCGHDRMMVYNYRVQENGPRWSDSLTNKSNGYHWYQMTDSVFWRWEGDNILLWKVGEKAHEIRLSRKNEGCSQTFEIERIHQWFDGGFIALGETFSIGENICQYAVLDTIARTLIYKRLDQDLEWIKKCNDVRARGDDVYCVILDDEGENSVVLKNENDTIPAPRKFAIGGFWGDMIKMSGNICNIKNDKITCSDVVWYGNELKFYQNGEIIVDLN